MMPMPPPKPTAPQPIDVLCVGHASYDLVFAVPHHPKADEKIFADSLIACGGGPAANAAVTSARLGFRAAFAGYLGNDAYGELHRAELERDGVATDLVVRGTAPTPVSAVLVKPDGTRALVNYKGETRPLPAGAIDFSPLAPSVILFDGHEPNVSLPLARRGVPTVLDAGSVHAGTEALMFAVDYLVCSEKFARQWLGADDPERALTALAEHSPAVVITLGERGLIWRRGGESGRSPAFPVETIDTTGAGDAFHGAFAAALAGGLEWTEILRYASAAGALCCTRLGARLGIPDRNQVMRFLESRKVPG
jgi:sulfofructose kinase